MFDKPFGFYFLLFIILTLFFKFYAIIDSFLPSIATACVLAYLTRPIYRKVFERTKNRSVSAFVVLFFTFVLILVPITFIGIAVQQQVQYVMKLDAITFMRDILSKVDTLLFERFNIEVFDKYLQDLVTPLLSAGQEGLRLFVPKMIMSVTQFALSTFITFFLMYYLLLNAEQVIRVIRYYGPLNDENMDDLLAEMGKDTRTLILGQLLIAVMQGALTGIGFLIFGVPAVILWGLAAVITSFLPVLGAGIIWFPGCIYLFLQDRYFAAAGLLLWGAIVVSTSDNIIRPKLVNMLGEIHPVTVLLGVFIGIKEWGLVGIVLGPLIISVLITLIKMFREQFLDEA